MKNIAIVCGGYSGEYEISINSAETVSENLSKDLYHTYVIVIGQEDWYYENEEGQKYLINRSDFTLVIEDKRISFDGIFNAIHGTPGEDGVLLAYFDLLGLPYTSSNMEISALTFNKYLCNKFVQSTGVAVAKSFSFVKGDEIDKKEVIEALGLPLFIKPAKSGSSVGVSKVKTIKDFDLAVENAFKADDRLLIEEFLDGREMACGLFPKNGKMVVLPITEIISKNDFFDYEAKYKSGMATEVTPSENISEEIEMEIKATSSMLYHTLACRGVVRIDYMLTESNLYFIEINTIPGMSKASIIPQQIRAMGMGISELFEILVEDMFL